MKKVKKVVLSLALALTLLFSCATVGFAAKKSDTTMYVGVGSADITGPITSISNGYNSVGNLIEGLLMRLHLVPSLCRPVILRLFMSRLNWYI